MLDFVSVSTALSSLASLAALWFLGLFLFRDYQVDRFRQSMFALRDELFDLAARGELPFDHPAYVVLRQTMNGFIRFGHRIGLIWLVPVVVTARRQRSDIERFSKALAEAETTLRPETRERLGVIAKRMNSLLSVHLLLMSPLTLLVLALLAVPLLLIGVCILVTAWCWNVVKAGGRVVIDLRSLPSLVLDEVDSAALAMGSA